MGIAVVPTFFCGLLVRIPVAADWAVADSLVNPYGFNGVFLDDPIPSEASTSFEAVLGLVDFLSEFFSQNIPRSISDQTVDRAAVAKKKKCWGAHDSILSSNFAVSIAGEDIQPGELDFSSEVSRDRI